MKKKRCGTGRIRAGFQQFGVFAMVAVMAGVSAAEAPSSSLRPQPRLTTQSAGDSAVKIAASVATKATIGITLPVAAAMAPRGRPEGELAVAAAPVLVGAGIRPRPRGGSFEQTEIPGDSRVDVTRMVTRIHYSAEIRPSLRPTHPLDGYWVIPAAAKPASKAETTYPMARPAAFAKLFRKRDGGYSAKGSVCGVPSIKGVPQKTFGKPGRGCGIADPVLVTSVAGVKLSTPAKIDCKTAKALNAWVENGIKPAVGQQGGGVKELKVAAHYACRNRNNRSGGRLSEHAKGHAVDISAIRLNSGAEMSVLKDWRSRRWSKTMRSIHRAACGPFGTVLGPNADRYHQDHFHVDTARYRSGTYCR